MTLGGAIKAIAVTFVEDGVAIGDAVLAIGTRGGTRRDAVGRGAVLMGARGVGTGIGAAVLESGIGGAISTTGGTGTSKVGVSIKGVGASGVVVPGARGSGTVEGSGAEFAAVGAVCSLSVTGPFGAIWAIRSAVIAESSGTLSSEVERAGRI